MDELILKFLEKQTNSTEETMIKRWVEDSDNNQYYFQLFSKSWQECCTSGNNLLFKCIAAIH